MKHPLVINFRAVRMSSILKWSVLINVFKSFKFKTNLNFPFGFKTRKYNDRIWDSGGTHCWIAPTLSRLLIMSCKYGSSLEFSEVFLTALDWTGGLSKLILYPDKLFNMKLSDVILDQASVKCLNRPAIFPTFTSTLSQCSIVQSAVELAFASV